jgi:hypothetical protein
MVSVVFAGLITYFYGGLGIIAGLLQ